MINWLHNQLLLFVVVSIDILWDILTSFFLGCLVAGLVILFIYMALRIRSHV